MEDNTSLIMEGTRRLGVSISQTQVSQFLIYLQELKTWNAKINLTAIRTDRGIITRHFLDSLAGLGVLVNLNRHPLLVAGSLPDSKFLRVLDVGTGAGFPGIPMKICRPQLKITLLEPAKKKVAFLHTICGRLKLRNVEILNERLEGIAKRGDYQGAYDILLTRALKPALFLKESWPILRPGGRAILWASGSRSGPARGSKDLSKWCEEQALSYQLPFEGLSRRLMVFRKVQE